MANPLVSTLVNLRGNPRACTYTEPLWGLSMALCFPYASVYMAALGVRDMKIGLIATLGMVAQVGYGILGGVITDKLGRRRTTAIFDFVAWSVPCLIWFAASLVSQQAAFWFFVMASVVNAAMQVTQNSWDCLLVEDAEREQIPHVYSLIMVASHLSALFAPIAAVLVSHFSLVTAVRILYANAFIVITIKLVWLYFWSHETDMGKIRMEATRHVKMRTLMAGYKGVLGLMVRSPGVIFALVIAALVGAINAVTSTFWQLIINKKFLVPDAALPFFPMIRSMLAIVFFFTVIHRVTGTSHLRKPLVAGFGAYIVGQSLISAIPAVLGRADWRTYALLGVCLLFDSFAVGILAMLAESIVALNVDPVERSRVMAVQRMTVMLVVAPFGWISGALSEVNRSLPFVMTAVLAVVGVVVTLGYYRRGRGEAVAGE